MSGFFVSFEGGEGAGKSTQIMRLQSRLQRKGRNVVITREPGGPPSAEAIRELLITGKADRWADLTECLLMNAARSENLARLIRPALAQGAVVLTDRFADSTRAYQGAAGGIEPETIRTLEKLVVAETKPDVTFILDLPVEIGFERTGKRGSQNRFETKALEYHERVRAGFLAIAQAEPLRCVVIDALQTPDAIAEIIFTDVMRRMEQANHG